MTVRPGIGAPVGLFLRHRGCGASPTPPGRWPAPHRTPSVVFPGDGPPRQTKRSRASASFRPAPRWANPPPPPPPMGGPPLGGPCSVAIQSHDGLHQLIVIAHVHQNDVQTTEEYGRGAICGGMGMGMGGHKAPGTGHRDGDGHKDMAQGWGHRHGREHRGGTGGGMFGLNENATNKQ